MYDYHALYEKGLAAPVGNFLEDILEEIYVGLVKAGDCVVDAGANVGRHTFPMAACVGPGGHVFAFEAIPRLCENLNSICEARQLGQVRVIPVALGAREGQARFRWVVAADGLSGLRERNMTASESSSIVEIDVPVAALDTALAARPGPIRFIKADLEGGEYHMLMGASGILRRDRPVIVFENGREPAAELYEYSRDDWFSFFRSVNYSLFDLFGRPFGEAQWWELGMPWYTVALPNQGDVGLGLIHRAIDLALARSGKGVARG